MGKSRSPRHPNFSLKDAIYKISAIFDSDALNPLDRETAAVRIGYSSLSGASETALATLTQFGLLDRIAKGEVKVTDLAVDILHPDKPSQKANAITLAARAPKVYQELFHRYATDAPSQDALESYLRRIGFTDSAVKGAAKAFIETYEFVSNYIKDDGEIPSENGAFDNSNEISVGDYIQWENNGMLQFREAKKVRFISDDEQWLAVDGSDTGIPKREAILVQAPNQSDSNSAASNITSIPNIPPAIESKETRKASNAISVDWMTVRVSKSINIRLVVGEGDEEQIGPNEIEKLIKVLQIQKEVLS